MTLPPTHSRPSPGAATTRHVSPGSFGQRASAVWHAIAPPLAVSRRDLWVGSVGMAIALVMTELLCRLHAGSDTAGPPWFIAPMAATSLLVFFMPASPVAQPWPVLAGSCLSALVGVTLSQALGHSPLVGALAAAVATALMFALRCLHPPGAAVAMVAVLVGSAIEATGYGFALWPVGANALCLVFLGLVLNNASGRSYPHRPVAQPVSDVTAQGALPPPEGILPVDLDGALASFDELLDIEREDLEAIIARAEALAHQRRSALVPSQGNPVGRSAAGTVQAGRAAAAAETAARSPSS